MFKNHLKRMLAFMAVLGVVGWLYASSLPKIYEATVDIQAGSPAVTLDPSLPPDIARRTSVLLSSDLDTDVGIIKSQKTFAAGLAKASDDLRKPELRTPSAVVSLFPMYEVTVPGALNQYQASNQRIIQVRVRAFTALEAASIANGVGYAFTEFKRAQLKEATADTSADLRRRLQAAQAASTKVGAEYEALKRRNGTPDIAARLQSLTAAIEALQSRRSDAEASLTSQQAQVTEIQARLASGSVPKTIPGPTATVADSEVDIAKSAVARAREQYEAVIAQFQDDAPQSKEALGVLNRAIRQQSAAEAKQRRIFQSQSTQPNPAYLELISGLSQAKSQVAGLQSSIRTYDEEIARRQGEASRAPQIELQGSRLLLAKEIADKQVQTYQLSLSNYEGDSADRTVKMLGQADPTTIQEPVAPEVRRWVILALFAGALLGLAYSFALESFRLPVHTSWQLAELTALPVAAAVPAIPKPLARRHEAAIREGSFKPIESFRYMAFSLLARENRPKTVMFTGVGGDVGASTAAAEFAVATARTGAKTILVDCDLRSPQLSTLFGVAGRTGVSDILGRTVLGGDSADLLVATEHEGLMILPAGTSTESGLADFQTSHIEGLLNDLGVRADLVVLDLPAVDIFSDAARLAHFADEACLVVSAKTTSYRAVPMAQEIVEKAGARSVSIVLTNASSNDEPFGTRVSDSLVRA